MFQPEEIVFSNEDRVGDRLFSELSENEQIKVSALLRQVILDIERLMAMETLSDSVEKLRE